MSTDVANVGKAAGSTWPFSVEAPKLEAVVADVLDRWPSAGIATAVLRHDGLVWSHVGGVADTKSRTPVDESTVFRIGSVTKTITAVAVMQLWEQGLVDLDAPVSDYLRSFRLVPAEPEFGPVTLRHLLTHTAGIGYWPRPSDLLRPGLGSGVQTSRPARALSEYLRAGLRVEVEPGTKWMYSNHGFATLGQVVEDVTGEPFDRYLRNHVFDPLGMEHTDLVLSERIRERLASGYVLGRHGLQAAAWRDVPTPGGGAVCSTMPDMVRYVAALLGTGADGCGSILRPETLASMYTPHFRPDPRLPGMGLAFDLGRERTHRIVGKDGVVAGFLADIALAPDDDIGVIVLVNTGGLDARGAASPLALALMRHLLGLPDNASRTDVPSHPEVWADLCGWYDLAPGPMTNLFMRLVMGAGAEVRVKDRQLLLQPLTPVAPMRHGMRLDPDDPDDPYVFRIDMSHMGKPPMPVAFTPASSGSGPAQRLCFGESVLNRRPDRLNPRLLTTGLLGAGICAAGIRAAGRRVSSRCIQGAPQSNDPL